MIDTVVDFFGFTFLFPAAAKQLLLAAVFGLAIGLDRSLRRKAASFGTFSMISTGSCLFAILSVQGADPTTQHFDVTRIAAQIVTGIGFLGGGVIFKTSDRVEGVTTGAMIWLTAAVGMACGFNRIELVLWAFVIGLSNRFLAFLFHRLIDYAQAVDGSSSRQRRTDFD